MSTAWTMPSTKYSLPWTMYTNPWTTRAATAVAADPSLLVLLPAFLCLCLAYPLLARFFPAPRQHAWILTTLAALTMTLASVPFVLDYAKGGVHTLQPRPALARSVNRFFQAYLAADLLIGALFYRAQVGVLTGWVHHAVYIAVCEVALRAGWAHHFCFAACMEMGTSVPLGERVPRRRLGQTGGCGCEDRVVFTYMSTSQYTVVRNSAITCGRRARFRPKIR
ncbi:hypothetical protein B0H11DRAFT_2361895 [Mycena galericulata]|nr:hypothetical protein B0H11DRAFT_2361895 [Mycena galericulata]